MASLWLLRRELGVCEGKYGTMRRISVESGQILNLGAVRANRVSRCWDHEDSRMTPGDSWPEERETLGHTLHP